MSFPPYSIGEEVGTAKKPVIFEQRGLIYETVEYGKESIIDDYADLNNDAHRRIVRSSTPRMTLRGTIALNDPSIPLSQRGRAMRVLGEILEPMAGTEQPVTFQQNELYTPPATIYNVESVNMRFMHFFDGVARPDVFQVCVWTAVLSKIDEIKDRNAFILPSPGLLPRLPTPRDLTVSRVPTLTRITWTQDDIDLVKADAVWSTTPDSGTLPSTTNKLSASMMELRLEGMPTTVDYTITIGVKPLDDTKYRNSLQTSIFSEAIA